MSMYFCKICPECVKNVYINDKWAVFFITSYKIPVVALMYDQYLAIHYLWFWMKKVMKRTLEFVKLRIKFVDQKVLL